MLCPVQLTINRNHHKKLKRRGFRTSICVQGFRDSIQPLVANVRQTRVMAGWTVELTSPEVMGGGLKKQEKTLGRTGFPKYHPIR